MPARALHPLLMFLLERGVGIAAGARVIGVGERTLREWISWRSRPSHFRAADIAIDLGLSAAELFPPAPAGDALEDELETKLETTP